MTMVSAGLWGGGAAAGAAATTPVSTPALVSASISACDRAQFSLCALMHASLCVPSNPHLDTHVRLCLRPYLRLGPRFHPHPSQAPDVFQRG